MARRSAALALWLATTLSGCATLGTHGVGARTELPGDARLLPARVRRLSNLELERAVRSLTGVSSFELAKELPPDVRQEGYTPNAKQDVSTTWATRYSALVADLATRAASQHPALGGCENLSDAACRSRAIAALGLSAFRRPLEPDERTAFESLVSETAAHAETPTEPLAVLLRALLESPSFLYLSELGSTEKSGRRALTDYELAAELAFTLRGGPPDAQLLEAARLGQLRDREGRLAQAERLLSQSDTRYQFRRFALEWLEVDSLLDTAKSSRLFPDYDALKPFMLAETESYVDEVLVHGGASVHALLAGGFASVGPEMARFYGLHSYGPRASLRGTGRLGVLQQASFLAAHAHEELTSPVKRGDFVMRKLLCERVKRPAEIGLEVVMPPPSATLTNRERLSRHVSDPGCAVCHQRLDPIGFTFESFDASGGRQLLDHAHPVKTDATIQLGPSATQFGSSQELTRALAESPVVSECFARHAFRYFSAQADPQVEASFVALRRQLPEGERDNLLNVLLAYVASDLFVLREGTEP